MKFSILIGICVLAFLPGPLRAQTAEEAPRSKFQFGALGLTPRIAVKDIGVDTNPLNDPVNPERDVTATVAPALDSTLRIGRARLLANTAVEYQYFNRSQTQRSFNFGQDARGELVLSRVIPFAVGGYLRTRRRPNAEIDQRVQQNATIGAVGTAVKLGGKTRVEFEGRRISLRYSDGKYGDPEIARALDRDSDTYSVSTRIALTPLTTFVVRTETLRDRFLSSPQRDSDSVIVLPGFDLKPLALVSGKIAVGYRHFDAIDRRVPDFGGIVGLIDASYTWREATRFAFKADRTIEYSIEEEQPYFVANSGVVEVTQIIGLNWFAIARAGRTRLEYRNFVPAASAAAGTADTIGRSDRVDLSGFGFGRRIGEEIRVGFDVNHVTRTSVVKSRQYEGYRFGVSISYGS